MAKHRSMFMNPSYGWQGMVSYLYYFLYELISPFIQLIGWLTMAASVAVGVLNLNFMIQFYLIYTLYNAVLTITIFFQRIYTMKLKISLLDIVKAIIVCILENVFFRLFLDVVRVMAFIGYGKRKNQWGRIKRVKQRGV